jgi:DNA repair protein RecN (Recombination protein N)
LLRSLRIENLVLIRAAELELAPGLNVLTGETGAGKTIFAQAIGLLLGARGDAGAIGAAADEAYVEAELDVPEGFFDEPELAALDDLRPEDEPGLVLARRIFADGRTRAYAWGRSVAREDLAAAAERLIAMSGQFEQRRLGRPSYQLDVLDEFCGEEQAAGRREAREAWRALVAARRRLDELSRDATAEEERLEELRVLVQETEGIEAGDEEALRSERERLLHAAELVAAVAAAADAVAPDEGDGAASLAARAERALEPAARIAPELAASVEELRDLGIRLSELGGELHRMLSAFEADPARLEHLESRLERIAGLRRRFRCDSTQALLERRDQALDVLAALEEGADPVAVASRELDAAETRYGDVARQLGKARREAAPRLARAVETELAGLGMGEGEFRADVNERDDGPTGSDEVVFLVRLNAGLPFAPLAETASGGELSRVALALVAAAATAVEASLGPAPQTLVFDEIDAGIGGRTAHRVAETLQRLAASTQVLTITHLPQIANVADAHFRVEKVPGEPTWTQIEHLDDAQRRDELERMLGGQEFLATLTRGGGENPGLS